MNPSTTCWTLIKDAAGGDREGRENFAKCYQPVVEAYLRRRWGRGPLHADHEDATQEVLMECLKEGGALERARPRRAGGFRAFLHGVTRNVASRFEERRARLREKRLDTSLDERHSDLQEDALVESFDRVWAVAVLEQTAALQREQAAEAGPRAVRRVELLQLRFSAGLPIREIAARWDCDTATVHKDYAQARKEFERALRQVVLFHDPDAEGEVTYECRRLLALMK